MSPILSNPYEGYPRAWGEFESHIPSADPKWMGFKSNIGDINRFGARFRLAKSFQTIDLAGYSEETQNGYSSLFSVFLAWSAFERFIEIIGVEQRHMDALLIPYDPDQVLNSIKSQDAEDRFYHFIYERVNNTHRNQLESYFNDEPCNITYLASAIRHKFAHGSLTPNANEVDAQIVIQVCKMLHEFLINVMDQEFSERVTSFSKNVSAQFEQNP